MNYHISGLNKENIDLSKVLKSIYIKLIREDSDIIKEIFTPKTESGKTSFIISDPGIYKICAIKSDTVDNTENKKFDKLFIKLNIGSDIEEKDLSSAVKMDEVSPVSSKINSIINKSKFILQSQKQEAEIEDSFSMMQMSYTSKFTIICIFQIVVVIIVGLYHIFSFKKFLENNNLL